MRFESIRKYLDREDPRAVGVDAPGCAGACLEARGRVLALYEGTEEAGGLGLAVEMEALSGDAARAQALRATVDWLETQREAERGESKRQGEELQALLVTLNQAVMALASGGEQAGERLGRVEASLARAAGMGDLASMRSGLQETVRLLKRESEEIQKSAGDNARAFGRHVEEARGRTARAVVAPGREQACALLREQARSGAVPEVVVVVFERLAATRARFGGPLAEEALATYIAERANALSGGKGVYRWSADALIWQGGEDDPAKVFEYKTFAGGRPVVLSLQGRWMQGRAETGVETLIDDIDLFARGGTRRW